VLDAGLESLVLSPVLGFGVQVHNPVLGLEALFLYAGLVSLVLNPVIQYLVLEFKSLVLALVSRL